MNYYNENDPFSAQWLRELMADGLIPQGDVDERSIAEVQPADLKGYIQHHFFAGIAGWSIALRRAGWRDDEPVFTGSCPCQPFSSAGRREGAKDERDLWPEFRRLIDAIKPKVVIGEQVSSSEVVGTELEAAFVVAVQAGQFARANKIAKRLVASRSFHFHPRWLTRVRADLETSGYAVRWGVLGAHSVRSPNIRQRLLWVANVGCERQRGIDLFLRRTAAERRIEADISETTGGSSDDGLANTESQRHEGREHTIALRQEASQRARLLGTCGRCSTGRLADTGSDECRKRWDGIQSERGADELAGLRIDGRLSDANGGIGGDGGLQRSGEHGCQQANGGAAERMGNTECDGMGRNTGAAPGTETAGDQCRVEHGHGGEQPGQSGSANFWSDSIFIPCRDGKLRRVPAIKSGFFQLVDGVPTRMDGGWTACGERYPLAQEKIEGRIGLLRGFGNAINPEVVAEFIKAIMRGDR